MKPPPCTKVTPRRSVRGFTLVELLIAATISTLLLLLLVQVLVITQDLWLTLRKKSNASQECRVVLSVIQSDIRAMYKEGDRTRGIVPFYIIPGTAGNPPEVSFLAVADLLSQDPASASASSPKSDLCIVSYRLVNGQLVRRFSNSDETYGALKARINGFINPADPTAATQSPANPEMVDQPWYMASTNAVGGPPPTYSEENLSPYVVAFEIVPYRLRRQAASPTGPAMTPRELDPVLVRRIAGTSTDQWPKPFGFPEHTGPLPKDAVNDPDYSIPDMMEVRLVVIEREHLEAKGYTSPQFATLAASVQRDISDGELNGFEGEIRVIDDADLRGLNFATLSIATSRP